MEVGLSKKKLTLYVAEISNMNLNPTKKHVHMYNPHTRVHHIIVSTTIFILVHVDTSLNYERVYTN